VLRKSHFRESTGCAGENMRAGCSMLLHKAETNYSNEERNSEAWTEA
jgi:hypothetical protein